MISKIPAADRRYLKADEMMMALTCRSRNNCHANSHSSRLLQQLHERYHASAAVVAKIPDDALVPGVILVSGFRMAELAASARDVIHSPRIIFW